MKIFNEQELQAANSIINAGLKSAAERLSFFMKENIVAKEVAVNDLNVGNEENLAAKYDKNAYLLITEVVGELNGICCLIFDDKEVLQLQQKALPEDILNNPAMLEMMSEAILLEVDNIIAAAVITQFSNLLKRKMHGSVPHLKVLNRTNLTTFISEHLGNQAHIINFKTTFISSVKSFNPMFIWFMNQPFIEDVKAYATTMPQVK